VRLLHVLPVLLVLPLLLGLAAGRLLLLAAPQRTPLSCGLQEAPGQLLLEAVLQQLHLLV
jgi:hypothetical protein